MMAMVDVVSSPTSTGGPMSQAVGLVQRSAAEVTSC